MSNQSQEKIMGDEPSLRESLTPELEARCLAFDPFAGDETAVADLSDRFVVGRKAYECQHCAGPIGKGERHRAKTERNDEEHKIMTFRFCVRCCISMAVYQDYDEATGDYNDDFERRYTLGTARRDPEKYAEYVKLGIGLADDLAAEMVTSRKDGSSQQIPPSNG